MYIRYSVPEKECLHYQVSVETYSENAKQKGNILTYDCVISLKKETWTGFLVNIRRDNILLNKTKIQEPINEVLLIAGRLLQNLDLEINHEGNILRIRNIEEIKKYWEEIKVVINESYKGSVVERVVDSIEKNIEDEALMINSLYKDPFFYYYLKYIYGNYPDNSLTFNEMLPGLVSGQTLSAVRINNLKVSNNKELIIYSESHVSKENIESLSNLLIQSGNEGNVKIQLNTKYNLSPEKVLQSIHVNNEVYYNHLMEKNIQVNIARIIG